MTKGLQLAYMTRQIPPAMRCVFALAYFMYPTDPVTSITAMRFCIRSKHTREGDRNEMIYWLGQLGVSVTPEPGECDEAEEPTLEDICNRVLMGAPLIDSSHGYLTERPGPLQAEPAL